MATDALTYSCPHCGTPVSSEQQVSNEVLTCPAPNCRKPFQAKVPVAEPVPERDLSAKATATLGQPPLSTSDRAANYEEELQTIRVHMVRRYPVRFLAYMLLI